MVEALRPSPWLWLTGIAPKLTEPAAPTLDAPAAALPADGFARDGRARAASPQRLPAPADPEAARALAREARARRTTEAGRADRARARADDGRIHLGDHSARVLRTERRLARLGYDVGAIDGTYDRQAARAVNAFRADEGIRTRSTTVGQRTLGALDAAVTGQAHDPERRRVEGSRASRREDARVARAARATGPDGQVGLGEGDRGREVRWVQRHLTAAGYDPRRRDGVFDERTRGALEQFQRRSQLPVTGRVDAATWRALSGARMESRGAFDPAQREGERSAEVRRTERQLRALGYRPGPVDGLYSAATQRAVDAFRKKHHLGHRGAGVDARVHRAIERALEARRAHGLPTSPRAFIDAIAPGAKATDRSLGVPASVTIAQAILESGWGRSSLAQKAFNLFGIKGRGPAGSIYLPTREYVNGHYVTVNAAFRKYHNPAESIRDHGELLAHSRYYVNAMRHRNDSRAFARALDGVYATDPNYSRSLIALMDQYNLYRFDQR